MPIVKRRQDVAVKLDTAEGAQGASYRTFFGKKQGLLLNANLIDLAPGGNTKMHKHDPHHIHYVLEGVVTLVSDDGEVDVPAGDAIYMHPQENHYFCNKGDKPAILFAIRGPLPPDEM